MYRYGLVLILLLPFIISCSSGDLSSLGKVSYYNPSSKKSFSFLVQEEFLNNNPDSTLDKEYPMMSVGEVELLTQLLSNNNHCINRNNKVYLKGVSRQNKIYDVTFSSLIEKNYNARPVVPVIYFGECF